MDILEAVLVEKNETNYIVDITIKECFIFKKPETKIIRVFSSWPHTTWRRKSSGESLVGIKNSLDCFLSTNRDSITF